VTLKLVLGFIHLFTKRIRVVELLNLRFVTRHTITGDMKGLRQVGACRPPLPFRKGTTGEEMPFHNSNFMLYQDRLETNLLQLFAQPENSQWFSIFCVIICEGSTVAEQKHE